MQGDQGNWVAAACRWLGTAPTQDLPEQISESIRSAEGDELEALLSVVAENFDELPSGPMRLRRLMQQIAVRLQQMVREEPSDVAILSPDLLARLADMLASVDEMALRTVCRCWHCSLTKKPSTRLPECSPNSRLSNRNRAHRAQSVVAARW